VADLPAGAGGDRDAEDEQFAGHPHGRAGDLYAEVKVIVPQRLTAEERELFERLARTSTFDPRQGLDSGKVSAPPGWSTRRGSVHETALTRFS